MVSSLAHAKDSPLTRAMLLTSDELPGAGWVVSRDIAYAVGAGRRKTAEIKPARQSSGITVFRSFRNDNAHLLWSSLTCFASPNDAKSSSLTALEDAVRNPRPGYSVTSSRRVAQADLPDQLRDMVVSEAHFPGPSESGSTVLVAYPPGNILVVLNSTRHRGASPWEKVVQIVSAQVNKIEPFRDCADGSDRP
jgi:hypothetical protein